MQSKPGSRLHAPCMNAHEAAPPFWYARLQAKNDALSGNCLLHCHLSWAQSILHLQVSKSILHLCVSCLIFLSLMGTEPPSSSSLMGTSGIIVFDSYRDDRDRVISFEATNEAYASTAYSKIPFPSIHEDGRSIKDTKAPRIDDSIKSFQVGIRTERCVDRFCSQGDGHRHRAASKQLQDKEGITEEAARHERF